jgi:hypothetical protein
MDKCFVTTLVTSNESSANFRAFLHMLVYFFLLLIKKNIAATNSSVFFFWTKSPVIPGIIASLHPETSVVTIAFPQAAASINIFGKPSP